MFKNSQISQKSIFLSLKSLQKTHIYNIVNKQNKEHKISNNILNS